MKRIQLNSKNLKLGTIESKIQFNASVEGETDLYLHGDVGETWWDDSGITAKKVIDALDQIETETVNVHINTYGGDVFEGISIFNILRASGKNIVTIVDGIAASAGSLIFLAGDTKKMPVNTQLMIHNPWTYARGNANDLEKVVDMLRTTESAMTQTYMETFVGTEEELKELLDSEKFMTADEAKTFGFVDEIITKEPESAAQATIAERLMSKYGGMINEPNKNQENKKRTNPLQNFMNLFEEETNNV